MLVTAASETNGIPRGAHIGTRTCSKDPVKGTRPASGSGLSKLLVNALSRGCSSSSRCRPAQNLGQAGGGGPAHPVLTGTSRTPCLMSRLWGAPGRQQSACCGRRGRHPVQLPHPHQSGVQVPVLMVMPASCYCTPWEGSEPTDGRLRLKVDKQTEALISNYSSGFSFLFIKINGDSCMHSLCK